MSASGISALAAYGDSDVESEEENDKSPIPQDDSPIDVAEIKEDKHASESDNNDHEEGSEDKSEVDADINDEIDISATYNISDTEGDHLDNNKQDDEDGDIKGVEDMSTLKEESEEENIEDDNNLDASERLKRAAKRQKRISSENATALAKRIRSASVEEILIPPAPEGRCSQHLQDKIKRLYEKKMKDGANLNSIIQGRKDFRNPSIYEKLILYLGIEELGTNFSPEDYNPNEYRKYPAYDELARAQREDMAKREKEKKTKVEFVTGTARKNQPSNEASRKSKWDQQHARASSLSDISTTKKISAVGLLKSGK